MRACSYKLAFECSNNEAEYEAMIIGLKILRKLNAKRISIYGDSKLVIKQVRGEYQEKHARMQAYRNVVLDILRLFLEYTLTCVPHMQNSIVDALAKAASNLKIPMSSAINSKSISSIIQPFQTISGIGRCFKMMRRLRIFCSTKESSRKPQLMQKTTKTKGMVQMKRRSTKWTYCS